MNKQFGTSILASAAVKKHCDRDMEFRSLGSASAKGRQEQIEIYELVGMAQRAN